MIGRAGGVTGDYFPSVVNLVNSQESGDWAGWRGDGRLFLVSGQFGRLCQVIGRAGGVTGDYFWSAVNLVDCVR